MGKKRYNHPFIGCLFVNDHQYIHFCNSFEYYISLTPRFGPPDEESVWALENDSPWYKHQHVKTPYPVMYLGDVEIHWIHETDTNVLLETYNRRLERLLRSTHPIVFLWSHYEILNDFTSYQDITDFISIPNSLYITKDQKNMDHPNTIFAPCNRLPVRNESHVYVYNDQDLTAQIFANHLKIHR